MKKSLLLTISMLFLLSCLEKNIVTPVPYSKNKAVTSSEEVTPSKTKVAIDPKVKIGVLDNGLTYYIRQNKKPENRIEMRLVINAGSILEEDNQQGLAHFLEHMAFNGTKNFKKMELVNYLESIGMRFGADLNAYTSFEETVYMLQIPTDDEVKLEKGFQILEDWAHGMSIEGEEVEKERGVILEEWRLRRGAGSRIQDKQFPIMFKGSKYAERLPIGKTEIIKTAERERFTSFYQDWYRPNLMAVIVIGDMEPEAMEAKIKAHFDGLKNPENLKERPKFDIPDHEGTLFSAETDPEMTRSMIQIMYKKDLDSSAYEEDLKLEFTKSLYGMMINNRLQERGKEADPPYLFAYSGFSSLGRNKGSFSQFAMVKEDGFEKGISVLLEEAHRIKLHGFSQTELDRTKTQYLRALDNQVIEADKQKSRQYAGQYVSHFLSPEDTIIPSAAQLLEYAKNTLNDISLDDVQAITKNTISKDNRIVLLSGPEKEGLIKPTEEQVDAWIAKVEQTDIKAYEDDALDQPLLANIPEPGKVLKIEKNEAKNITYMELSNGIRVFLKPTDFLNDDIQFTSYSPGGSSLAPDDQLVNAQFAAYIVRESGLGEFSSTQLEKKMAGKLASANAGIGNLFEGVSGSCSTKDTEEMFQLLYLNFTAPRLDLEAVESVKNKQRIWLKNRLASPKSVFGDAFQKALFMDHPRTRRMTLEDIDKIDGETALSFYKERFADSGDFTFIFVGNFVVDELKSYIEKYIASLPNSGRKETWKDNEINPVRGVVPVTVRKGLEQQSSVRIQFKGYATWSPEQTLAAKALSKVLSIRLREILREDQGGVYGVGVYASIAKWPKETFSSGISFGCAPDNVDNLINLSFDEIKRIQKDGINEDILVKVRETFMRKRELDLKENNFWVNTIEYCDQYGIDINKLDQFKAKVDGINSDMIKNAAISFFDFENVVIGKLFPEETKEKEPTEAAEK